MQNEMGNEKCEMRNEILRPLGVFPENAEEAQNDIERESETKEESANGTLSGLYKGTYGDKVARGEIPPSASQTPPFRQASAFFNPQGKKNAQPGIFVGDKNQPTGGQDGALKAVGSARVYYYNTICKVTEEELPKEYKVKYLSNVLDQGYVNSCVAHGVAGALSANHLKNTGEVIDLSVLLIYGLWRGDMVGEGMFMESTLENGREIGTSPREYAPENLEVPEAIVKAKEYAKEYPNALAFKVGSFYKMRENANFVSDIKKALYQFDLPLVTVKNGSSRHCELIVGWDEDNFILQNSRGTEWGNEGFHKMPLTTKSLEDTYLVLADKVKLPFSDTEGHWGEKAIRNLYFAGIMEGYPDGTFRPDAPITRAEAAKVIDEVMKRVQQTAAELQSMKNE